jgi:hypothetical protein
MTFHLRLCYKNGSLFYPLSLSTFFPHVSWPFFIHIIPGVYRTVSFRRFLHWSHWVTTASISSLSAASDVFGIQLQLRHGVRLILSSAATWRSARHPHTVWTPACALQPVTVLGATSSCQAENPTLLSRWLYGVWKVQAREKYGDIVFFFFLMTIYRSQEGQSINLEILVWSYGLFA